MTFEEFLKKNNQPSFRLKQLNLALYKQYIEDWSEFTTWSKELREKIAQEFDFNTLKVINHQKSKKGDTEKVLFSRTKNKQLLETVIMKHKDGRNTVCVSCMVGCPVGCTFCATGTMGLKRNLHSDEIIDQYRFWQQFLVERPKLPQRISNIVFMGMGEPLANYDNVKNSINTLLKYTDLGPTKIMLSTVGILPQMQKLLTDPDWPKVRIAISLHSANQEKRKEIVPTTVPDFLKKLAVWSHEYQRLLGNRNHKLTFEYTLISHVNDTPELAQKLAKYIVKTAVSKINVIPYNPVKGKIFNRAEQERVDAFKNILRDHNINVTERTTMGADIDAACGQLAIDATI